ncbi:heme-thiolate peroxidase [Lasiodiplodia mahajangana]|uniref:Heme-thiolate peroxidase n=1 Tax=Lasiodiplodia mahajangana TaxID=1108764 RepID=A0ACC2JJ31_9PEZI|nr:heme-thiolate peroxidase [Lasiodiplodia mahajangana]
MLQPRVQSTMLVILVLIASCTALLADSLLSRRTIPETQGQTVVGHNDLYYPNPQHPIPYKIPFVWDESLHYFEKQTNGSGQGYYRRSSCPGVNALANRGYVNRSGRNISYDDIGQAARTVWNFGDDNIMFVLEGTKKHYPGVDRIDLDMLAGDAVQYDINCPAAPTRSDRALGDNVAINMTLFDQLISASKDGITLSIEDAAEHHHRRHNDSKANNPEFRFGNQMAICSLHQYANMFGMLGRAGKHGLNTLFLEDVKTFYLEDDWPLGYARREMPYYSPEGNSYVDRMTHHIGYRIQRPYPPGDGDKDMDIEPETAKFQLGGGCTEEKGNNFSEL